MTVDYTSPGVTYHRELAMRTLERLTHRRLALARGKTLPQADYMKLMRRGEYAFPLGAGAKRRSATTKLCTPAVC